MEGDQLKVLKAHQFPRDDDDDSTWIHYFEKKHRLLVHKMIVVSATHLFVPTFTDCSSSIYRSAL